MSTAQFAIDLVKSLPGSVARDVSWWMADRRPLIFDGGNGHFQA
jgi:hypothetical protein